MRSCAVRKAVQPTATVPPMSSRTPGPVEIAQLNSAVFRDFAHTIRTTLLPYFATVLIIGLSVESRVHPTIAFSKLAAEMVISLFTTIPVHAVLFAFFLPLLVGVATLVGWRHVLSVGLPERLVALIRAASRVIRLELLEPSPVPSIGAKRLRERATERVHQMIERLCRSLVTAPSAPPLQARSERTNRSAATGPLFSWRSV